jgi:DNA-binding HxlR family transcriptional regulator
MHTRFVFATQLASTTMTNTPLLRRSPVSRQDCNLAKSFELIGDRWTLLILRSALYGLRRFDHFHADLDMPRSVLSNRLAALIESGIMEYREYREPGQRTRIEYPLTRMGRALSLPFMAMTAWADKWLGDGTSPLTLRSKSTGQKVSIALVDERGNRARKTDIELIIDKRSGRSQPQSTRSSRRRLTQRRIA